MICLPHKNLGERSLIGRIYDLGKSSMWSLDRRAIDKSSKPIHSRIQVCATIEHNDDMRINSQ
jgi:hypothetical protein